VLSGLKNEMAHSYIELFCLSFLINVHIDDFSSSRLELFRNVKVLTYLLSGLTYHYLYFIYACLLEIVLSFCKEIGHVHVHEAETEWILFLSARFFFVAFSLIPILYLAAFSVKNSSDPLTIVSLIIYLVAVLIFYFFDLEDTFMHDLQTILVDSFPFNYFKFDLNHFNVDDQEIFLQFSVIQFIYGIPIFMLVLFLRNRERCSHKVDAKFEAK